MNTVKEAVAMLRIAGYTVIPYEDRLSIYEGDTRIILNIDNGCIDAGNVYLLLTASQNRVKQAVE